VIHHRPTHFIFYSVEHIVLRPEPAFFNFVIPTFNLSSRKAEQGEVYPESRSQFRSFLPLGPGSSPGRQEEDCLAQGPGRQCFICHLETSSLFNMSSLLLICHPGRPSGARSIRDPEADQFYSWVPDQGRAAGEA